MAEKEKKLKIDKGVRIVKGYKVKLKRYDKTRKGEFWQIWKKGERPRLYKRYGKKGPEEYIEQHKFNKENKKRVKMKHWLATGATPEERKITVTTNKGNLKGRTRNVNEMIEYLGQETSSTIFDGKEIKADRDKETKVYKKVLAPFVRDRELMDIVVENTRKITKYRWFYDVECLGKNLESGKSGKFATYQFTEADIREMINKNLVDTRDGTGLFIGEIYNPATFMAVMANIKPVEKSPKWLDPSSDPWLLENVRVKLTFRKGKT